MEKGNILEIKNITKSFGGIRAIDGVSFSVKKKQIKALVGPNGAGKTTLFNILTGIYRADSGEVIFKKEKNLFSYKPHRLINLGISRTFQNIQLVDSLTIKDNIALGLHSAIKTNPIYVIFGLSRKQEREVFEKVDKVSKFLRIEEYLLKFPNQIPFGVKRLVEIARALVSEPELILLDEPAAGLNERETELLLKSIFRIWERNISILLIEHDVEFVTSCSHSIVVMDSGKKIAEGLPSEVMNDRRVIKAYMGE